MIGTKRSRYHVRGGVVKEIKENRLGAKWAGQAAMKSGSHTFPGILELDGKEGVRIEDPGYAATIILRWAQLDNYPQILIQLAII